MNETGTIDDCARRQTCAACQQGVACGWCADATGTGTGACHNGGLAGVMTGDDDGVYGLDLAQCPLDQQHSWHFVGCPGELLGFGDPL